MASETWMSAPTVTPTRGATSVGDQPADRLRAVLRLVEDEAHGVEAIGEVVREDGDEDEQAGRGVRSESEADREAVDEAVGREAESAEGADLAMRTGVGGLIAVMEDEDSLEHEEGQEARTHQRPDGGRIGEEIDRLGEDVEERDRDHDPAAERNHRRE